MKDFKETQEHARHLVGQFAQRNQLYDAMEAAYLLLWEEESRLKREYEHVRITKSPDSRNKLNGAIRLLTATDPIVSVPFDTNSANAKGQAEKIEQMGNVMLQAAGRVRGDPVHYDVVRSALLFGEVHISVESTAELVTYARGKGKAVELRAKNAAMRTPYLFNVHDPRTGYPEMDSLGLKTFYREETMLAGAVRDNFPKETEGVTRLNDRYQEVTVCDYWDLEYRHVWIAGEKEPIISAPHGLPFIPWVVHLVEGSQSLFKAPEDQRQPFLYTDYKSGMWENLNLLLSVLFTNVFSIGANPIFVEEIGPTGARSEADFSTPGGMWYVPAGNKIYPMANKGVIDPSMTQALDIAERKHLESTLYSQVLGEPLGANAPFSMVSLLSQAGRLPLIVAQRKAGWALADALKLAFVWMKETRGAKARYASQATELKATDIPDDLEVEVKLDIDLPQDKLQASNIGRMLIESQIASKRWVRENIMQIGQSDAMDEEIWSEQASMALVQLLLKQNIQELMPPTQQPGAGMPPEMGMPPGGAPAPGPGLSGLPPEMAEGGGAAPQMGPGVPPGELPPGMEGAYYG